MTTVRAKEGDLWCELGEYLGEGREGICHRVSNSNTELRGMVLKEMFDSQRALKTLSHIERLLTPRTKRSFCETPSLECLLVTLFMSEEGKCCLLMPEAHGTTLLDVSSLAAVMKLSLDERLLIAYQIASGTRTIHQAGIIHADIAGPNIIIDTQQIRAFILDMDGGGIVNSLPPRIKGHHGDWMAPELQSDSSPPPNQHSDCWSLAVVLHEIITGLSPFYFCSTIQEISKYVGKWPPSPKAVDTAYVQWSNWHRQILDQIPSIVTLFKRTFNMGQKNPQARPSASEWEQVLQNRFGSLPQAVRVCPQCGQENSQELIYCHNSQCSAIIHRVLGRCHNCRCFIPINAKFCPECGNEQIN